jgi:hypothetical protein
MKAYSISDRTDADKGMEIVWARNGKEARGKQSGQIDVDCYIDLQVLREPAFDNMENATQKELMFKQWKEGWWFWQDGCPSDEGNNDSEFYDWFEKTFEEKELCDHCDYPKEDCKNLWPQQRKCCPDCKC